MNQTLAIVGELKRALRESQVTYRQVGVHLGVSEASVKRLFSNQRFSLERVEDILNMLGLRFSDLVDRIERRNEAITQLTPEQETALVADSVLLVIAFLLLNRWSVSDILAVYDFTEAQVQSALLTLNRLNMIELLPFNKVRLLTARNFKWREDGPVQRFFAEKIQSEFFDVRFDAPGEELRFLGGTLTPESLQQMADSFDRLAAEFDSLAEKDSKRPFSERYGCSAVLALRPMEYSMFAERRIVREPKKVPLKNRP